jgi:hypothetical protein
MSVIGKRGDFRPGKLDKQQECACRRLGVGEATGLLIDGDDCFALVVVITIMEVAIVVGID